MDIENVTADATVFTANAFLVTEGRRTLVDAGAMAGVTDRIESLDAVVLTHQHQDHIAELEAVVSAFDPAVYAAAPHPLRTDDLSEGDSIEIGTSTFVVVETPGHAADHISLCSEHSVFSGDVVVYNDGAFDDGSFGRTDRPGQSRTGLIESLARLLTYVDEDVLSLYPGHGDSYHGDVRGVIERALDRARRREPKYPNE